MFVINFVNEEMRINIIKMPFKANSKSELVTAVTGWLAGTITSGTTVPGASNSTTNNASDTYGDIGNWDVSSVTDMSELFKNGSSSGDTTTFNDDISNWDVSNVTNMREMFNAAYAFNQDIGGWDVSQVTDMDSMFNGATNFNKDISQWNVSQVTTMNQMFSAATNFNQDIGNWNVSAVTDMSYMFNGATAFNQDIGNWNVSNVENMTYMFGSTTNFNQDIGKWNVSAVTNMLWMFKDATAFNQDITKWNVSAVTIMYEMFDGATVFDQNIKIWAPPTSNVNLTGMFDNATAMASTYSGDSDFDPNSNGTPNRAFFNSGGFAPTTKAELVAAISGWTASPPTITADTSVPVGQGSGNYGYIGNWDVRGPDGNRITDMSYLFNNKTTFNDFIGNWDVSNVTNMREMFNFATNFNQDIGNWNVSAVENMTGMFYYAQAFNQDITKWNVSSVTNMYSMFQNATAFNQDIGGWDVSQVTDMESMFKNADDFNQDIGGWDVSAVTTMLQMFNGADAFNQDIGGWDVSQVKDMYSMFRDAIAFNKDISRWNVSQVTDMGSMFRSTTATAFNQDIGNWNVSAVTDMSYMFNGATAFNQDIGQWNVSAVTDMSSMFRNAGAFNQDIRIWAPNSIQSGGFNNMFSGATTFNANTTWNGDAGYGTTPTAAFFNSGGFAPTTKAELVTAIAGWIGESIDANTSVPSGQGSGNYGHIGNWDVSSVTDMDELFKNGSSSGTTTSFNDFIGNWDVSNVTTMVEMFNGAAVFNQPIGNWNVSQVTDMTGMFFSAAAFNQDIGQWNVSQVTDMRSMFYNAAAFNQDISRWNVSAVTNMGGMFYDAGVFNQDIGQWDVSKVTNMGGMFRDADAFNQDIGQWNVSQVTDMPGMFRDAIAFNQDIRIWSLKDSSVALTDMFNGATAMNTQYNASTGNTPDSDFAITPNANFFNSGGFAPTDKANLVTAIAGWIDGSIIANTTISDSSQGSGKYGYIGNWDVSSVTDMSELFKNGSSSGDTTTFNDDISDWDVSNVTTMEGMFDNAQAFNQDINNWNVSKVTTMEGMFNGAVLFNQNITVWYPPDTLTRTDMFNGATAMINEYGSGGASENSDFGTTPDRAFFNYQVYFASSTATFNIAENQTTIGTVTATQQYSDSLTYSISGNDANTSNPYHILLNTSTGDLTFNSAPDFETPGSAASSNAYTVTVTATDTDGNSATQTITVNVTNVNESPTIDSSATFTAAENQTAIGTVTATDPEGATLTYSVSGSELEFANEFSGVLTFVTAPDYETKNTYTATVTVSDGTNSTTQDITVNVTNVNESPTIDSSATFTVAENQTAIGTVTATDPEGATLTYSVSGSELAISSSGVLTFVTAPDYETKNTYTATVTVSDGTNSTTQDITVNVTNVNDPPTFTSSAVTSATQDVAYSYTVSTSDPDGNSVTVTATTKPDWLSFDGTTLSGTPLNSDVGSHNIVLTASDGSLSTTQSFTILVANVNDLPTFTSTPVTSATQGQLYNYIVITNDVDIGDNITLTVTTKPDWLSLNQTTSLLITRKTNSSLFNLSNVSSLNQTTPFLNQTTKILSGTPSNNDVGSHNVVLTATDSNGTSTTQSFTIVVANVNDPPTFTSDVPTSATQGELYSYTVTTNDIDGDTVTVTATTKPSWLSFDGTTLSGTPTSSDVGNHNIVLTATDGALTTTQSFTIVVVGVNVPPKFTSTPLRNARQESFYSYTVTTNNTGITVTATKKPNWLSFDGTTLSGTPTRDIWGQYKIILTASNGSDSVTQEFTIMVKNPVCFNAGTGILCLKNGKEQYIRVGRLMEGDLVKTLDHGYKKIVDIRKGNFKLNGLMDMGMYKMKKQGNMTADLEMTGLHCVLVDKNDKKYADDIKRQGGLKNKKFFIDGKFRLRARESHKFQQMEAKQYTIFSFALEDEEQEQYGIWANGALVETTSRKMLEISNMIKIGKLVEVKNK